MKTEFHASYQHWADEIGIFVKLTGQDGKRFLAKPLELTEMTPDGRINTPTMSLRGDEAQNLMDELWRAGLRPKEGSGSAGSLAATERHLADMKAIAFGALKKSGIHP